MFNNSYYGNSYGYYSNGYGNQAAYFGGHYQSGIGNPYAVLNSFPTQYASVNQYPMGNQYPMANPFPGANQYPVANQLPMMMNQNSANKFHPPSNENMYEHLPAAQHPRQPPITSQKEHLNQPLNEEVSPKSNILFQDDEDLNELMINYSTQREQASTTSEAEKDDIEACWFDESFNEVTKACDGKVDKEVQTSASNCDKGDLEKEILDLKTELKRVSSENQSLKDSLKTCSDEMKIYVDLYRSVKGQLDLIEKEKESRHNAVFVAEDLLNDILLNVIKHAFSGTSRKEDLPVTGFLRGPIEELRIIESTSGLCPYEQVKLSILQEASQSEEYQSLLPISSLSQHEKDSPSEKRVSEEDDENVGNPAKKARIEWDGHFSAHMKFSGSEKERILKLMRCDHIIFTVDPKRIPTTKNPALLSALTMQDDPALVFKLWNTTRDNYKEVTGAELDETVTYEENEDIDETSCNRLGRDLPDELLKVSNSQSFYKNITTVFNKLAQFSTEVPEFAYFDWVKAATKDVDFALKIFIEWQQPLKNSCAMGTRTTTGTNKTYKTGLQNVCKFVLKRPDVVLARYSCSMALTMQAYKGKNAAYAASGQTVPEGSRERKAILDEDQKKRDEWLTRPLNKLSDPEELSLTVAAIVGDQACHRGVSVLKDIGRSAFKTNQYDENGKEYVLVHQAVRRKKDQGYANKPFRPFKKMITGDFEVQAIKLLLSKLPVSGCDYCCGPEGQKCVCDEFLLRSLPLSRWSFNDQVWYARQKWSDWKKSQVNAEISK